MSRDATLHDMRRLLHPDEVQEFLMLASIGKGGAMVPKNYARLMEISDKVDALLAQEKMGDV